MAGMTIPTPKPPRGRKGGRPRRSRNRQFGLQLTSLMDVLIIIVVFLLKSYAISEMTTTQENKLVLPQSKAPDVFGEGLVLRISQDRMSLDSEELFQFEGGDKAYGMPETIFNPSSPERGILPLLDALIKIKENFEVLASKAENQAGVEEQKKKWTGELLVQADKSVPYDLLRKVMVTAGRAGYQTFRLTVEKEPQ